MSTAVVKDRMPQFKRSLVNVMGDALKEGARDGLIKARTKAPFEKGRLRAESDIKKINDLKWRIAFYIEYARFQEFGGDGKRTVRNYSASGTGKGFLRSAGDEQAKTIARTFKKHAGRARA